MAGTAGAKTALDQVEGGDELYDACMTADFLTKPVKGTAQSVKCAGQRIKNTVSPAWCLEKNTLEIYRLKM
ncbi:MAG: hypothetical protein K2K74_10875 [Lachnospiraceae bacterium]|nr:hypothetical protein [Lachnospiraceae bacterium]